MSPIIERLRAALNFSTRRAVLSNVGGEASAANPPTVTSPELLPLSQDPEERYKLELEAFTQQPEIVEMRRRIDSLGVRARHLVDKPDHLRIELEQVSLERDNLASKSQQGHLSKTEIRETAQSLERKRRRIIQIPGERLQAQRELPNVRWEQRETSGQLASRELAWAKEGGEDRVVFFAVDRFRNNPEEREKIFMDYSRQRLIPVEVLRARFDSFVGVPERVAVVDDQNRQPNVRPMPQLEEPRKRRRGNQVVGDQSVPRNGTGGFKGRKESSYVKPTRFEIVVGVNQEPIPVTSLDELKSQIAKIKQLGPLQARDIWDRVERLANMDLDQIIRHERVAGGPFKGWYKYPIGRRWDVIFEVTGGRLTFKVGSHESVYGTR